MNLKIKIGIVFVAITMVAAFGIAIVNAQLGSAPIRAWEQSRVFTGQVNLSNPNNYTLESYVVFTKKQPSTINIGDNFADARIRYEINMSAPGSIEQTVVWAIGNYAHSQNYNLNTKDVFVQAWTKSTWSFNYN